MKIKILVIIFCSTNSLGFSQGIDKGDFKANIYVGLISMIDGFGNGGVEPALAPSGVVLNYGIIKNVSAGIFIGSSFGSTVYKESNLVAKGKFTHTIIGIRSDYFFNTSNEKIIPYIGGIIGNNFSTIKVKSISNEYVNKFNDSIYSLHVGVNYKVMDKIDLLGEIGFGLSLLKLGSSFNLN